MLAEDRIRALAGGAVETPVLLHAAWHLPRRPRSEAAAKGLRMQWDVPLEKLRRLHKHAVRAGDGRAAEMAAPVTWVYDGERSSGAELRATHALQLRSCLSRRYALPAPGAVSHPAWRRAGGPQDAPAPGQTHIFTTGMGWTLELQADYLASEGGVSYGLFVTPSLPPTQAPKPGKGPAAAVTADISLNAHCSNKHRSLRAGGRMQLLLGREGRGESEGRGRGRMLAGRKAACSASEQWHALGDAGIVPGPSLVHPIGSSTPAVPRAHSLAPSPPSLSPRPQGSWT